MKGGNSSLCLMSHTKWRIIPIRLNCITESMATVEFFPGACTSAHHKVGLTPLSRFKVLSVNKLLINTMDLYMVLGTGIQNKEKHGFIAWLKVDRTRRKIFPSLVPPFTIDQALLSSVQIHFPESSPNPTLTSPNSSI